MVRKNKQVILALAVIGGFALSGCSGAPAESADQSSAEPVSEPSTAPAKTAEATAEQLAKPEKPAGLSENTEQGLETAMRYWVDLLNYSVVTGDTATLKEFSDDDCRLCEEQASQINEAYASGGRIEGGEFTMSDVSVTLDKYGEEDGDEKHPVAYFKLERTAGKILDAKGAATSQIEAVSCKEAEANWDEVAYDKDGNFIGSICSLVAQGPEFDDSEGWEMLNIEVNPQ